MFSRRCRLAAGFVKALLSIAVVCCVVVARAQGVLQTQWAYGPIVEGACVTYSPDGTLLAVGGEGGVQVFSVSSGAMVACPNTAAVEAYSVAFSPDGKTLAIGGFNGGTSGAVSSVVEFWSVATWTLSVPLSITDIVGVTAVAYSPDGSTLAVGGYNNTFSGQLELWSTSTYQETGSIKTAANYVNSLAYSPDGSTLAVGGNTEQPATRTGVVELWNVTSGAKTASFDTAANYNLASVAFSSDGTLLADGGQSSASSGSHSGVLEVWTLSTGKGVVLATTAHSVNGVAFVAGTHTVAEAGQVLNTTTVGVLETWNVATGAVSDVLATASVDVYGVAPAPDGKALADCGQDSNEAVSPSYSTGRLEEWDLSTGTPATPDVQQFTSLTALSFSPAGSLLASSGANWGTATIGPYGEGTYGYALDLWNVSNGTLSLSFGSAATNGVTSVAFSPAGSTLADGGSYSTTVAGPFGVLETWNSSTGKLIASLATRAATVNAVAYSPDGTLLADGGTNTNMSGGVLELWKGGSPRSLSTEIATISSVALSPADTLLAACGFNYGAAPSPLEIWNLATGGVTRPDTSAAELYAVAFSPDGTTLADGGITSAPATGIIEQWDVSTGLLKATIQLSPGTSAVLGLAFSPDGSLIYAATNMGIQVVGVSTHVLLQTYLSLETDCVAVSPSGTLLAYGGQSFKAGYGAIFVAPSPPLYSVSNLTLKPTTVQGGGSATGTVTISTTAPAGGATIGLTSNSSSASVPVSVTIAAGAGTATFTVTTSPVESQVTTTIAASAGSGSAKTALLTITQATLNSVALNPTSVVGGNNSTGTVSLSGPAGPNGAQVSLASSDTSAASVPTAVNVAAGQTSGTFTVSTHGVSAATSATITAQLQNGTAQTATLAITPAGLVGVVLSPVSVVGGNTSTGTVTLSGEAPTGGVVVSLSSSSATASVMKSVTVQSGQGSATFTVGTSAVSSAKTVKITADLGTASKAATLTVDPPALETISLSPNTVAGGASSTGTVTLSGPAVSAVSVKLSSSTKSAKPPVAVTIARGKTSATFTVKTVAVAAQTVAAVSATASGVGVDTILTIKPPSLVSVAVKPTSVVGGRAATGTVTLGSAAPAAGVVVGLSSSSGNATVPESVKVAGGQTKATFTVKTSKVGVKISVTIGATLNGTPKTAVLTVT